MPLPGYIKTNTLVKTEGLLAQELQGLSLRIASFCSPRHLGNIHKVQLFDDFKLHELNSADQLDGTIQVALVPHHSGNRTEISYKVACFQNNYEMQFCGSGLLAAARYIFEVQPCFADIQLIMNGRVVNVLRKNNRLGFRLALLNFQASRQIRLWRQLVGKPVQQLYKVGGHKGYIIAVLNSRSAVLGANVKLHLMRMLSGRVLILTAPGYTRGDFVFRYFAPQYGNDEDIATGSAFSILLPYWALRTGRYRLRGEQLSQQGGLFFGEYSPPYINLYGQSELY